MNFDIIYTQNFYSNDAPMQPTGVLIAAYASEDINVTGQVWDGDWHRLIYFDI